MHARPLLRHDTNRSLFPFENLEARQMLTGDLAIAYQTVNAWNDGFQGSVVIENRDSSTFQDWQIEFDFSGSITNIWNAVVESSENGRYVVTHHGYNQDIYSGSSVDFGFLGTGPDQTPTNFRLVAADGTAPPTDISVIDAPAITINDVVITEGNPNTQIANGYFHTEGNQIVDENGQSVRIAGINWFGFETSAGVPHGLFQRNYQDMLDQVKDLGFNTLRLPFSNSLFDRTVVSAVDANPDLQGLTSLQVLDRIVDYSGKIGLRIILDRHTNKPDNHLAEDLWYIPNDPNFSEEVWINNWVSLANRYANNPTVIGGDLNNEPHGVATWGSGDVATDWKLAAERAGNAILAENPNWLIFVEGIQSFDGEYTWWGANLMGVREHPVELIVPNRVVYSPHDYATSVYEQSWLNDPSYPENLPELWDQWWGYIYKEDIAPIWLGEFGSTLQNAQDQIWLDKLTDYLDGDFDNNGSIDIPAEDVGMSWTYWSLNPNSGDTGGILQDDWLSVDQNKLSYLLDSQFRLDGSNTGSLAQFEVQLSAPQVNTISVNFHTEDITAVSGQDYAQATGTLVFPPGLSTMMINVPVTADLEAESTETFSLILSGPSDAELADSSGTATILDDDTSTDPFVSIDDVTVPEGNAGTTSAQIPITLSASTAASVTVDYTTSSGSATSGIDFVATKGRITFSPGETDKLLSIDVLTDTLAENDEQFTVDLTAADAAIIRDDSATITIQDDDALPRLSASVTDSVEGVDESAVFTATLSSPSEQTVTVEYKTVDGTTQSPVDYLPIHGILHFAPGETTKSIPIKILDDLHPENTESFFVRFANAEFAVLDVPEIEATITDNDLASALPVQLIKTHEWQSGFTADVIVNNTGSETIEDWFIEFSLQAKITNIWNAEIVSHIGDRYVVRALDWNANIATGGSAVFGFQATASADGNELTSVLLNGESVE